MPLESNLKKRRYSPSAVVVVLVLLIAAVTGTKVFAFFTRHVAFGSENMGSNTAKKCFSSKEQQAESGIALGENDYISLPLTADLHKIKDYEIQLQKGTSVYLVCDGEKRKVFTWARTVGNVLEQCNIKLNPKDKVVGYNKDTHIYEGMEIKVVRVEEKTVTEKTALAYRTVKRPSDSLDKGQEIVIRHGKQGEKHKVFKIIYEDGKEIARSLINEFIAVAPVEKIVEYGTVMWKKTSRGDIIRYSKVYDMRATAYTASFKDTGKKPGDKGFGITYTGVKARRGIIAVDPKVIPLGSRVYVEGMGSVPDYGIAVAADIGGAIKGNKIDLYVDTQEEADKWGVKRVRVYILK